MMVIDMDGKERERERERESSWRDSERRETEDPRARIPQLPRHPVWHSSDKGLARPYGPARQTGEQRPNHEGHSGATGRLPTGADIPRKPQLGIPPLAAGEFTARTSTGQATHAWPRRSRCGSAILKDGSCRTRSEDPPWNACRRPGVAGFSCSRSARSSGTSRLAASSLLTFRPHLPSGLASECKFALPSPFHVDRQMDREQPADIEPRTCPPASLGSANLHSHLRSARARSARMLDAGHRLIPSGPCERDRVVRFTEAIALSAVQSQFQGENSRTKGGMKCHKAIGPARRPRSRAGGHRRRRVPRHQVPHPQVRYFFIQLTTTQGVRHGNQDEARTISGAPEAGPQEGRGGQGV